MTAPHAAVFGQIRVPAAEESSVAKRFRSLLFPEGELLPESEQRPEPECFTDLNLDQIFAAVTAGREDYNLQPFFHASLQDEGEITYRQEVFRDVERPAVAGCIRTFAAEMSRLRDQMSRSRKLHYELQRQRCVLEAVENYCRAVRALAGGLKQADVQSKGLCGFLRHIVEFVDTSRFRYSEAQAQRISRQLGEIRYALAIDGKRVTVRRYEPEPDYGADVVDTFERFRQGAARTYRFDFRIAGEMNHIEAAILDRVALLYPEVFSALAEFCLAHAHFQNPVIAQFDREAQFYLAWVEHMQRFRDGGVSFCYPHVSAGSRTVFARDAVDLALAERFGQEEDRKIPVPNDFSLSSEERILLVSGPNQGGKTTFARMFGQLHYLAGLGCPVPAREAQLFLSDQIFTHFGKEEDVGNLTGRLEDELLRIRRILELATPDSILIMNESFLSTTLNDSLFLSREIMTRIAHLDMICVSVTFLDELAAATRGAVSVVGTVDPADPSRRTFKLVRRPADGLAYAMAIAEKYCVTHDAIRMRIAANARRSES